jgi:hypothetical protein
MCYGGAKPAVILFYSQWSVTTGSTIEARRAGMEQAAMVTEINSTGTSTNGTGFRVAMSGDVTALSRE